MNIGDDCVGVVWAKGLDTDMLRWLLRRYEVIVENKGGNITYELYGY
jgi:hypothetical protein